MIYDVVPTTGYSVSDINDTLGAGTMNVGRLVASDNVNMFARNKPTAIRVDFTDSWQDGTLGSCGLSIPLWNGSSDAIFTVAWSYSRPQGGVAQPYRFGDFRGYKHKARPFVTSGKTSSDSYDFDIRLRPQLTFTFDTSMFADVYNLNPRQVYVDRNDFISDIPLGKYYWGVLLEGWNQPQNGDLTQVWQLAGSIQQENGIRKFVRLQEGGNSIAIDMTATAAEGMKYRASATFFLAYTPKIVGITEMDIQNSKKVAVYAGRDQANGLTYINPVPIQITRSTGNIATIYNPWRLKYDESTTRSLSLWSTRPVKLDVVESSGIWRSIDPMPDGGYQPHGSMFNLIDIGFWISPNESIDSRNAKIRLYNGSSWGMSSAIERLEVAITQEGAPAVIKLNPDNVTLKRFGGYSVDVDLSAPRGIGGNWYLVGFSTDLESYPTPSLPWIQILNITDNVMMDTQQMFTGDKRLKVVTGENDTGSTRIAYAHFKFSSSSELATLKITQTN